MSTFFISIPSLLQILIYLAPEILLHLPIPSLFWVSGSDPLTNLKKKMSKLKRPSEEPSMRGYKKTKLAEGDMTGNTDENING